VSVSVEQKQAWRYFIATNALRSGSFTGAPKYVARVTVMARRPMTLQQAADIATACGVYSTKELMRQAIVRAKRLVLRNVDELGIRSEVEHMIDAGAH
jgi:hypothetical protein